MYIQRVFIYENAERICELNGLFNGSRGKWCNGGNENNTLCTMLHDFTIF